MFGGLRSARWPLPALLRAAWCVLPVRRRPGRPGGMRPRHGRLLALSVLLEGAIAAASTATTGAEACGNRLLGGMQPKARGLRALRCEGRMLPRRLPGLARRMRLRHSRLPWRPLLHLDAPPAPGSTSITFATDDAFATVAGAGAAAAAPSRPAAAGPAAIVSVAEEPGGGGDKGDKLHSVSAGQGRVYVPFIHHV